MSVIGGDAKALIAAINRKYGDGAIVLASDIRVARRFTSGSLSLDVALGGGWPGNQWTEVVGLESHGKTAVVYKTIAANQRLDPNFTTLWIAAEHYDTDQSEALGVDNSRMIIFPTQGMEEAYETMLKFAESKAVDCIVLDSYPALVADEEAEKGMDEAVMAVGARLTGKFFRKAGAATKRSLTDATERPLLGFVINQYRDAIGCLSYGNNVMLSGAHGKQAIGSLVNGKKEARVWSWDENTHEIVSAPVVQWHNNGSAEGNWLSVKFPGFGHGKTRTVSCTPNHNIMTSTGWTEAQVLSPGQDVMVCTDDRLNYWQDQLLYGSLLGDGTLIHTDVERSSPIVRFGHAESQLPYLTWKRHLLGELACSIKKRREATDMQQAYFEFNSVAMPEFIPLARESIGRDFSEEYFNHMEGLAIAIWVQDDGTLSTSQMRIAVKSLTLASRKRAAAYLNTRYSGVSLREEHVLTFSAAATRRLAVEIMPWLHPCMAYKLPKTPSRWLGESLVGITTIPRKVLVPVPVRSIEPWKPCNSRPAVRRMHDQKYDIGVDGQHNYFVNGLLVHNSYSPNGVAKTTPGGKAKNYAFYVRVEVRRAEWIQETVPGKNLKVNVGQTIKIKTIKNKSSAPQQTASVDFYFRDGPVSGFKRGDYDEAKELKVMAILFDVIDRRGAYFSFENGQTDADGKPLYRWQGSAAMEVALRSDLDLQEQVRTAVFAAVKDPLIQRDLNDGVVEAAETAGTKKVTRRKVAA